MVFFFVYLFYLVFNRPFAWLAKKCCTSMLIQDFEVDEEIDLYQNCLDDDDKEWTLMEEENSMKYGIMSMLHETKESIKNGRMSDDKFHL